MSFIIEQISFDSSGEVFFDFSSNINENLIFSILIGINGTGKSLFLAKVIEVFRDIERKKMQKRSYGSVPEYYKIMYSINGIRYNVEKMADNSYNIANWNDIVIPAKVLALSFLLEDKYTFQSDEHNEEAQVYKYLGVRNTANASFTKGVNKKISNIIFENLSNEQFFNKVKATFKLLNYTSLLKLKFEFKTKKIAQETRDELSTRISKALNKLEEQKYKNHKTLSVSADEIDRMLAFFHERLEEETNNQVSPESNSYIEIIIDFDHFREHPIILDKFSLIQKMVTLELLDIAIFEMVHESHNINDFSTLSSGEKNLLFITLNILANVEDNSLVVIDEPEISLHPEWQVQYNNHLKHILHGFDNVHIMIATHSHFLLSGLNKNEANVFSISKNREVKNIEYDTYGWSPENILYNVFGMISTRNHYFEADIKKLVYFISENEGSAIEIERILTKLETYNIVEEDPLNEVILEGRRFLEMKATNV